jgi:hypothetical protein
MLATAAYARPAAVGGNGVGSGGAGNAGGLGGAVGDGSAAARILNMGRPDIPGFEILNELGRGGMGVQRTVSWR